MIARSEDGGKTWSDYRCVTRYGEAPACLVELSDGIIVLTYGEQNFPFGARAMVSRDGGRNWDGRIYVLGYSSLSAEWYAGAMFDTAAGWSASSVAIGDEILTVYNRGSFELTEKSPMAEWYGNQS